jgi:hypothetical protein
MKEMLISMNKIDMKQSIYLNFFEEDNVIECNFPFVSLMVELGEEE